MLQGRGESKRRRSLREQGVHVAGRRQVGGPGAEGTRSTNPSATFARRYKNRMSFALGKDET